MYYSGKFINAYISVNRAYTPRTLKGSQPDPYWNINENGQSSINAIHQMANKYVYCMNNPVMWTDPSGMSAMSFRIGQRYDSRTGQNRNMYTLLVESRRTTNYQTVAGVFPGFSLLNWGAQRLFGFRNISMDWTVASGTMADVAGAIANVAGAKPIVGWAITAIDTSITYFNTRPEWQMREAVFNQFDSRIWRSFSRDTVDAKFRYAMWWMDSAMSTGQVDVMRARDHFGDNAFIDNDRIWRHDPLTGRDRRFEQGNWYFFALDEDVSELIRIAENNMRMHWYEVR